MATDYMRIYADQIREFVPNNTFIVLGTDGFGRSDTRANLRRFFEVDRNYVAYAALVGLVKEGELDKAVLKQAAKALNIDVDKASPLYS